MGIMSFWNKIFSSRNYGNAWEMIAKRSKKREKKISMYFTAVVTDLVWKNTTTSDTNCSSLNCTRLNLAWTLLKAFTTDLIVGVKKQKLVLPNSETFQFVYDFLQDSTLMVIYLTSILHRVPIRWYHWRSWCSWFHSLQLWQLL